MNGNGHGAMITVKRAAEMLNCSEPALSGMIRQKRLSCFRLDGRYRLLLLSEVRAMIEAGYEPVHGQREFWQRWKHIRPVPIIDEPVHSPTVDEDTPDEPIGVARRALACVQDLQPALSQLINGHPRVTERAEWVTIAVLESLDKAESLLKTLEKELGDDR